MSELTKNNLLKKIIIKTKATKVYKFTIQYPHVEYSPCHLIFKIKTDTFLITKDQFIKNYDNLHRGTTPREELNDNAINTFNFYINKERVEIDTRLLNRHIKTHKKELKITGTIKKTNEKISVLTNEIMANIINIECIN